MFKIYHIGQRPYNLSFLATVKLFGLYVTLLALAYGKATTGRQLIQCNF